jgi:hypothetical protein
MNYSRKKVPVKQTSVKIKGVLWEQIVPFEEKYGYGFKSSLINRGIELALKELKKQRKQEADQSA